MTDNAEEKIRHLQSQLEVAERKGEILSNMLKEAVKEYENAFEELRRAKAAAEESNRVKSEFLANMSHEIRTPMNAIVGLTNLTLKTELSDKQQTYLEGVRDSSHILLGLIDDILDFSKIEAGKLDLEYSNFQLSHVMNRLDNLFREKADEKALRIFYHIDDHVPSTLKGDSFRIGQILINLISNALKFTQKGKIVVSVRLEGSGESELPSCGDDEGDRAAPNLIPLLFSVKDTGIGIPDEKLNILFSPFTQADGSVTRKYGGTGLGLSICQRLVTLMNGTIWVESKVNEGSEFLVSLPLEPGEDEISFSSPSDSKEVRKEAVYAQEVIGLDRIHGATVLLVEDNVVNQYVATAILSRIEIVPDTAENGKACVEMLKKQKTRGERSYDAVLMDIQMPIMDGYEAARILRNELKLTELPIIAMTAHALKGDREKCLNAGMNDYVTKPIDENELFRALVRWIKPWKAPDHATSFAITPHEKKRYSNQEPEIPSADPPGEILIEPPWETMPDHIPGLQVKIGVGKVHGNTGLYRILLRNFLKSFTPCAAKVLQSLETGDIETAEELIHAVKGVSGNIAADSLFRAASALEKELKRHHTQHPETSMDKDHPFLTTFLHELGRIIDALSRLDVADQNNQRGSVNEYETIAASPSLSADAILPILLEMKTLLENSSAKVKYSLVKLKEGLDIPRYRETLHRLETAIFMLDSDKALSVLKELAEAMNMSLEEIK